MHGWARGMHPYEWHTRCAIVTEYLSQRDEEEVTALIEKGWPEVFEIVEKSSPEAFAEKNMPVMA